jgi:hypothetical protein
VSESISGYEPRTRGIASDERLSESGQREISADTEQHSYSGEALRAATAGRHPALYASTMHGLQRTHGNRALQRYIHASESPVQRQEDEQYCHTGASGARVCGGPITELDSRGPSPQKGTSDTVVLPADTITPGGWMEDGKYCYGTPGGAKMCEGSPTIGPEPSSSPGPSPSSSDGPMEFPAETITPRSWMDKMLDWF